MVADGLNRAMALKSNSKLEQVREAMASGNWGLAIRLAAKFPDLGPYKERISRAKDALNNPEMYTQLGYNLEEIHEQGIAALKEKFSKSWKAIQECSDPRTKDGTDI